MTLIISEPRVCCDYFNVFLAFSNPALRFPFSEVLEHTLHFNWVLQVRRALTRTAESGTKLLFLSALEP